MQHLGTLHHYVINGYYVYSCLLDASKAFDRIFYGKHFTILLSKQVPVFIIRYLLDCYIRQMSTEDQKLSINNLCSILSARSDLSFTERFNLVDIIDMIGYETTS